MNRLCSQICQIFHSPAAVFGLLLLACAISLAAAFTAEFAFGLEPCILCLYQRAPFAAVIALGMLGFALRKNKAFALTMLALCAIAFLINSGIAVYHTGVELHWWASAVEGCAVPPLGGNPDTLLDKILHAPRVPCDQIAWKDPVFGLTMANYNIAWSAGLSLLCLLALSRRCPKAG